jgi:hypothetical protein
LLDPKIKVVADVFEENVQKVEISLIKLGIPNPAKTEL